MKRPWGRGRFGVLRVYEDTAVLTPENSTACYCGSDLSGNVKTRRRVRANPAAASITGIDRRQLPTRRLAELATREAAAELTAYLGLLEEQGIGRLETRFRTADGEPLIIEMSSVQVAENRFVHMFDDVTALVQAQRDAAWGEVARRLAHEIRNPLTPIQLSAERMRRRFLDTMNTQDAQVMERATRTIIQQVKAIQMPWSPQSRYWPR